MSSIFITYRHKDLGDAGRLNELNLIKEIEAMRPQLKFRDVPTGEDNFTRKIFISHAFEDKDEVARPLAHCLIESGFSVWYDDYSLRAGDSLKQKIDEGVRKCDFAVVILSTAFFNKHWTMEELDGIVSIESLRRQKVLIPIWHGVSVFRFGLCIVL